MFTDHNRQPTILVTDAGRGSAIAFIRSLGKQGLRVIAADSNPQSLGFRSRYASDTLLYPAPDHDPGGFVAQLLTAARERHIDLIIPITDAAIMPLARARSQFAGLCKLAIAEENALETARNKLQTIELAHKLNVPTPVTRLVTTVDEAMQAYPEFGWPIVLKPMTSRAFNGGQAIESFTVSYAQDPAQLAAQMGKFEGHCPVLLQEYYPGDGVGVELLLHEGRPLAAFQHKRLREIPINGGASALRESVPLDPGLLEYATRLMRALCWTGLAMVEFKVGKQGPKLMEINGRVWGSLPLAVLSGMDFPAHLAKLYLSGSSHTAPTFTDYQVGVRARNFELDVLWILTVLKAKKRYPFLPMPRRSQALAAALDLLNPTYRFDILSLADPMPGLMEIAKIIQKVGNKAREAAA